MALFFFFGGGNLKVIKRGKLYLRTYRFRCEYCGSILQATEDEIASLEAPLYDGGVFCRYYDCPVCEKRNLLFRSVLKEVVDTVIGGDKDAN